VIGGIFGDHTKMKTAKVLLLCTFAAASACHKESGPPPPPKPHISVPAVVKKGPSAAELTVGMVDAASQGKAQVPVTLKFDLQQRPVLGQPLDINIAVLPQIDASAVAIQIAAGDGLTVGLPTDQIDLPDVEAGHVYRQSLKVTPTAEGVLLLNLTILLKHDEITESRAFSIPIIVDR
jgi:hypothetical protein